MNDLINRLQNLPRAAKWGLLAGVIFGGYFLIVEPVLDRTNRFGVQADTIENNLRRAGELAGDESEDGRTISNGLAAFGKPKAPKVSGGSDSGESIQRIVDEVLADHGVDNATKTERSSTLTGDKARAIAPDGKVERAMVEVTFEASQTTVAAVIADLERSPGISAISRVKIDRTSTGSRFFEEAAAGAPALVRANLTAEAWVFVRSRGEEDSSGGLP